MSAEEVSQEGSVLDPPLAQAVASVSGLDEVPVDDHVQLFDAAHEVLRDALTRPPQ
ncbi:MAG: hypothetical protein V9E81_01755 [Marmoricola sp.]